MTDEAKVLDSKRKHNWECIQGYRYHGYEERPWNRKKVFQCTTCKLAFTWLFDIMPLDAAAHAVDETDTCTVRTSGISPDNKHVWKSFGKNSDGSLKYLCVCCNAAGSCLDGSFMTRTSSCPDYSTV